jgi:hypothetical protein
MAAGALLLAMQVAHGHDFWIEAEPYSQDAAGPVAVSLLVGEHFKGETLPYIDSWIDRFELHDGMGMRPIEGVMGDDPAGSVQARTGGASWVAYQSTDDFVELPPDKFNDYLAMEGMEYIRPLRERRGQAGKPGREYYVRCVKALLWTSGEDGVAVDTPLGLTLEMIPLTNPYVMKIDDVLEATFSRCACCTRVARSLACWSRHSPARRPSGRRFSVPTTTVGRAWPSIVPGPGSSKRCTWSCTWSPSRATPTATGAATGRR